MIADEQFKILVINEGDQSLEIWRVLKGLKPVVKAALSPIESVKTYLAHPGVYAGLVISLEAWYQYDRNILSRISENIKVLFVYSPKTPIEDGDFFGLPVLCLPNIKPEALILEGVQQLINGISLSNLSAVRENRAKWISSDYLWIPKLKKLINHEYSESQQQIPVLLAPSSGDKLIFHNVQIEGDFIHGNKLVVSSQDAQNVSLSINGPTQITQESAGDQVNINQSGFGEVTSIHQTAGKDQININQNSCPASSAAGGKTNCKKCGSQVGSQDDICDQCGYPMRDK
jgi:hypothetical protein